MAVIPALWDAESGGSPEVRGLTRAWPTWQNPVSVKRQTLARCGGMPIVPGAEEAEMRESPEPEKLKLQ